LPWKFICSLKAALTAKAKQPEIIRTISIIKFLPYNDFI